MWEPRPDGARIPFLVVCRKGDSPRTAASVLINGYGQLRFVGSRWHPSLSVPRMSPDAGRDFGLRRSRTSAAARDAAACGTNDGKMLRKAKHLHRLGGRSAAHIVAQGLEDAPRGLIAGAGRRAACRRARWPTSQPKDLGGHSGPGAVRGRYDQPSRPVAPADRHREGDGRPLQDPQVCSPYMKSYSPYENVTAGPIRRSWHPGCR